MRFRTELSNFPAPFTIGYSHKMILMGSCFSDEIGSVLNDLKFKTLSNPFATIYNPLILCKLLIKVIRNERYTTSELIQFRNQYFHYDLHSSFADNSAEKFLKKISDTQQNLLKWLNSADYLFLTLGSAIGYIRKLNQEMVGNCHKVPATEFNKTDISIDEITSTIQECFGELKSLNPDIKLILTVSPVRHIKEGIIENNRSKSRLLESVNTLTKETDISYFPAYELILDDLRDYRFYKSDLVHPNEMAIEYVWSYFMDHYMESDTKQIIDQIDKLLKSSRHKAFNPSSDDYKQFVIQTIDKMKRLESSIGEEIFKHEKQKLTKSVE